MEKVLDYWEKFLAMEEVLDHDKISHLYQETMTIKEIYRSWEEV